jgi:hypothetical protein
MKQMKEFKHTSYFGFIYKLSITVNQFLINS